MTHDAQRMTNDEAESTCHDFLNLALARLEASAIFLLPAKAISGCEYRYSPGSSSEQNSRVNDYGDSGSTSYYCTRYNIVYHAVTHDRVVSSGYTSFSACSLEAGHYNLENDDYRYGCTIALPPRIVDRGIIAIGETSQTHHYFIAARRSKRETPTPLPM